MQPRVGTAANAVPAYLLSPSDKIQKGVPFCGFSVELLTPTI